MPAELIQIAPLADAEPKAVEALLDAAFGADRRTRTAYRLRAGVAPIPTLSFAALDGGRLVGSLQSWPVELAQADGARDPIVLVGPVAVAPDRQRDGIGRMLMHALIAAGGGTHAMMLIGDPEYYDRFFGFTAAATGGWIVPGPVDRHRLLARVPAGMRLPADGVLQPRVAASDC